MTTLTINGQESKLHFIDENTDLDALLGMKKEPKTLVGLEAKLKAIGYILTITPYVKNMTGYLSQNTRTVEKRIVAIEHTDERCMSGLRFTVGKSESQIGICQLVMNYWDDLATAANKVAALSVLPEPVVAEAVDPNFDIFAYFEK